MTLKEQLQIEIDRLDEQSLELLYTIARQLPHIFEEKQDQVKLLLIEQQFQQLATDWKTETGMLSVLSQKILHPAYQQIIGMGATVIPLLLHELKQEPNHWFWALKAITGVNPVKAENRGIINKMAEDWLEWGRKSGYCS